MNLKETEDDLRGKGDMNEEKMVMVMARSTDFISMTKTILVEYVHGKFVT